MFQLLQRITQSFSKNNQREFDELRLVMNTLSELGDGALLYEGDMSFLIDENSRVEKCFSFTRSLSEAYFSIPNQKIFFAKKDNVLYKIVANELIRLNSNDWLMPVLDGHFNVDDFLHFNNLINDFDDTLLGEEIIDGQMSTKWALSPKGQKTGWSKIIFWCDVKTKKLLRIEFYDSNLVFQKRVVMEGSLQGLNNIFDGRLPKSFTAQFDINSSIHTRYDFRNIKVYSDQAYKHSEGYNSLWDNL